MLTSVNLTISKLKQLFLEIFLDKTDKVSDVGNDSVLNATAYGIGKVSQKAIKDIAIVESLIFPQFAKGSYLDDSGKLFGSITRRSAIGSSTYLRVIAEPGTAYVAATHTFRNTNGISFEMEDNFTVGDQGFGYIKVRSVDTGLKTNVDPNTVTTVTPIPTGHKLVTNEYVATGGLDSEPDDVFRIRITSSNDIEAKKTLTFFNQLFQSLDDRILKTVNLGKDEDTGKQILAIMTQNGVDLTENELSQLLEDASEYFSITELSRTGEVLGVMVQNVTWHEVGGGTGIDFRVEINSTYNADDVRKQIQINLTKKLDFRFWKDGQKIEWDDLFEVVKNTEGVKYLPDSYFNPGEDEQVSLGTYPRVKTFVMRDLDGNIIFDSNGVLSPIFYPAE